MYRINIPSFLTSQSAEIVNTIMTFLPLSLLIMVILIVCVISKRKQKKTLVCTNCGAINKNTSNFCFACGSNELNPPQTMLWYTFFIKIRPWLGICFGISSLFENYEYFIGLLSSDILGITIPILTLFYILGAFASIIFNIILFCISKTKNKTTLLMFIKTMLIFETAFLPYSMFLSSFFLTLDPIISLIPALIIALILIPGWYGCNMLYFKKRLIKIEK